MRNDFWVPRLKGEPSKANGGKGPRVEPETTKKPGPRNEASPFSSRKLNLAFDQLNLLDN